MVINVEVCYICRQYNTHTHTHTKCLPFSIYIFHLRSLVRFLHECEYVLNVRLRLISLYNVTILTNRHRTRSIYGTYMRSLFPHLNMNIWYMLSCCTWRFLPYLNIVFFKYIYFYSLLLAISFFFNRFHQ